MIIVDFDHTLFQTKNFVDAIIKVFSRYGVSEEDFRQAYKKSIKDWEDVCGFGYTFEKNIDELKKIKYLSKDEFYYLFTLTSVIEKTKTGKSSIRGFEDKIFI